MPSKAADASATALEALRGEYPGSICKRDDAGVRTGAAGLRLCDPQKYVEMLDVCAAACTGEKHRIDPRPHRQFDGGLSAAGREWRQQDAERSWRLGPKSMEIFQSLPRLRRPSQIDDDPVCAAAKYLRRIGRRMNQEP